jgi:hypothetical protein
MSERKRQPDTPPERGGSGDARPDAGFKRHGPEPPENDSGPASGIDDTVSGSVTDRRGEDEGA